MRIILASIFIFLLVGCSGRTAEDAYKEGKYLESIALITHEMDEKGAAKVDRSDLTRFQDLVNNVMNHYENQLLSVPAHDYANRIASYEALLTMKTRLSGQFYSQQVDFFNHKYDATQLKKELAQAYYLYGNSIEGSDSESYYRRAELYRKGLAYYKYQDIEARYNNAHNSYINIAAREYYDQGKQLAQLNEHKKAAEAFANAITVYKPFGQYKDSEALFVLYDKKYRTDEASALYAKASQLASIAATHSEYRQIASIYHDVVTIYQPYGNYKDATVLAQQYAEKGQVKVYFDSLNYSALIQNTLRSNCVVFVNNPVNANVRISITQNKRYENPKEQRSIQAMSENILQKTINEIDENGATQSKDIYKSYYFNLETITSTNSIALTSRINISGEYQYSKTLHVDKYSSIKQIIYSGDVPAKYSNSSNGQLLSRNKLTQKAESEMESEIKSELNNIADMLIRL